MSTPTHARPLTAVLAASVGWLAWRAARRPAAEREPVQGRPLMIAAPWTGTVEIALAERELAMQFWNVGTEPATIDSMSLRDGRGDLMAWGLTRCLVQPGAVQDLQWPLPERAPDDGERCALRISYRDGSGIRYETAAELRAGRRSVVCAKFTRSRVGAAR
jgi:hypothetical protein